MGVSGYSWEVIEIRLRHSMGDESRSMTMMSGFFSASVTIRNCTGRIDVQVLALFPMGRTVLEDLRSETASV